jgi:hypothetical protein
MSSTPISLYIPCVFANVSQEMIKHVFSYYGKVSRIDIVPILNKKTSYAFVHFTELYNNEQVLALNRILAEQEQAKIYYKETTFWWVRLNTSKSSYDDCLGAGQFLNGARTQICLNELIHLVDLQGLAQNVAENLLQEAL